MRSHGRSSAVAATLVALFYAALAWIVMHVLIVIASSNHPDYPDPNVIIGGFMSHFFYATPVALIVKQGLARAARGRKSSKVPASTHM